MPLSPSLPAGFTLALRHQVLAVIVSSWVMFPSFHGPAV